MQPNILTYLIVCPLVLIAGFVDAVAGGGGMISLPAYLIAGVPVKLAAGTNKLANGCGTALAACRYAKSGNIDFLAALPAALFSLTGAFLGSGIAEYISERALELTMLAALPPVAVMLFFVKAKDGDERLELSKRSTVARAAAIGFVVGCYDGLIGPGTGTFLTLGFTLFLGYSLLRSAGCARIVNLSSNIASLIVFLLHGDVLFALGIPAIACSMLGNYFGARYAIKGGSDRIRLVMFFVLGLMFLRFALEFSGLAAF